jgi:hypothetical protein
MVMARDSAVTIAVISLFGTIANSAITAWSTVEAAKQKTEIAAVRQDATVAVQQATTATKTAQAASTIAQENRARLQTVESKVLVVPHGPGH